MYNVCGILVNNINLIYRFYLFVSCYQIQRLFKANIDIVNMTRKLTNELINICQNHLMILDEIISGTGVLFLYYIFIKYIGT